MISFECNFNFNPHVNVPEINQRKRGEMKTKIEFLYPLQQTEYYDLQFELNKILPIEQRTCI